MANTRYLRTVVEDYVRGALHDEYGKDFAPKFLRLLPGGRHEFDAVSEDGTVVASVKSASGLTSGGRVPSGKLKDCIAELYFLSLVEARERLLVLTTPSFYEIFTRATMGKVVGGVVVRCVPLPSDIQAKVDDVVRAASEEVSPQAARRAVAAELEAEADNSA